MIALSFISLLKSPIYQKRVKCVVVDEAHLIKEWFKIDQMSYHFLTRVLINLKYIYYTMSCITQFSLFGNQGQNQASLSNIPSEVES